MHREQFRYIHEQCKFETIGNTELYTPGPVIGQSQYKSILWVPNNNKGYGLIIANEQITIKVRIQEKKYNL